MRPLRLAGRVSLTVSLIAAAGMFVVWVSFAEPWPISRRHGPDTPYATGLFRYLLARDVPRGVHDVFAREEWGFGGDSIYSLRFDFSGHAIIDDIVRDLGLSPVPPAAVPRLRYFGAPRWWPTEPVMRQIPQAYESASIVVWVDVELRRAFLQRAGFAPTLPQS